MAIKDTYKLLRELLTDVLADLEKSENGNKAASQRVRTGTVKLEKLAKSFRKESIVFEKKNKGVKKTAKSAKAKPESKTAKAKPEVKAKPAPKAAAAKPAVKAKAAPKSKAPAPKASPKAAKAKTSVKSRPLSVKRATAKLPTKRMGVR